MKKKKFIKKMRAAGYPQYLINKAVNTVKLRGGSLSYKKYVLNFNFVAAITGAPALLQHSLTVGDLSDFFIFPRGNIRAYGLRADLVTIDENPIFSIDIADNPDETAREMWSKENPYINHKAESEAAE